MPLQNINFKFIIVVFITLCLLNNAFVAHAESQSALSKVIQDTIINDREIQMTWHDYQQSNQKNISLAQMLSQGFVDSTSSEKNAKNMLLTTIHTRAEQLTQQFLLAYLDYQLAKNQLYLQKKAQYDISLMNQTILGSKSEYIHPDIQQSEYLVKQALANLQAITHEKLSSILEEPTKLDFLTSLAVPANINQALDLAQSNTLNFLTIGGSNNLVSEEVQINNDIKACKTIEEILSNSYQNIEQNQNKIIKREQAANLLTDKELSPELNKAKQSLAIMIENVHTELLKKQELANIKYQLSLDYLRVHSIIGDLLKSLELTPNASQNNIRNAQVCKFSQSIPVFDIAENEIKPAITSRLNNWIDAWQRSNIGEFLSFYSSNFKPNNNIPIADWRKQRSKALFYNHHINIKVSELHITNIDSNELNISFKQDFKSDEFFDVVIKKQRWQKTNNIWLIVSESNE